MQYPSGTWIAALALRSLPCQAYSGVSASEHKATIEVGGTDRMSQDHYKDQNAQTALQEVISSVWASSLGIEKVGIEDNFFELGGASVVATLIVSRLRQMFQMDLPAVLLFDAPTIEELARYMLEHEAQPGLTEKTATLLKRIEGMTEEEVARSLGSK
jgi:acyl carrier protein